MEDKYSKKKDIFKKVKELMNNKKGKKAAKNISKKLKK